MTNIWSQDKTRPVLRLSNYKVDTTCICLERFQKFQMFTCEHIVFSNYHLFSDFKVNSLNEIKRNFPRKLQEILTTTGLLLQKQQDVKWKMAKEQNNSSILKLIFFFLFHQKYSKGGFTPFIFQHFKQFRMFHTWRCQDSVWKIFSLSGTLVTHL